jgi:aryl-alcohol dehydrogenase-like predicted oxidoreductase
MEFREGPEDEADSLLNLILDSGINFIDTSIDYGDSEKLIGKFISHRRSEFFLASKCGCPVDGDGDHIFTRDNIITGINQSLKRMKTDYLDLVQLHSSPSKSVIEENDVIQTLLEIKKEGKVRFIGTSSVLPALSDHINMNVFNAFQIPYSALNREHETCITNAFESGAGTIIRGGVSKGEFGGNKEWENFSKANLDDLLDEGESRTSFLLRFTLSHPELNTTIVGTKNPEHFKENLKTAIKGRLPQNTYEEAKKRLSDKGILPAN